MRTPGLQGLTWPASHCKTEAKAVASKELSSRLLRVGWGKQASGCQELVQMAPAPESLSGPQTLSVFYEHL